MKKLSKVLMVGLLAVISVMFCGCIPKDHIYAKSVTLNKTDLTLVIGDSYTLVATVGPDNAEDKDEIEWESENDNIVSVNGGVVTAVAVGKVKVFVYAGTGNNVQASCNITVTERVNPVEGKTFVIEDLDYDFSGSTVSQVQKDHLLTNKASRLSAYKNNGYQSYQITFNADGTFTHLYYFNNAYWKQVGTYSQQGGDISMTVEHIYIRSNQTGTPEPEEEFPMDNNREVWSGTTIGNTFTLTITNQEFAGEGVKVIHTMGLSANN